MTCKPKVTCEDVPCAFGQYCSESGVCEFDIEQCETDTDCPLSEICDVKLNVCIDEQLPCTDTFTCPLAQNCNGLTGFCEPDSVCSRDGCSVGETCNETTEECRSTQCSPSRSDCPVRFVCSNEGVCEMGCLSETECPREEFCLAQPSGRGVCVPSCKIDTDCPFGTTCELTVEASRCEREPSCMFDNECRLDEICLAGNCIQPPCEGTEDCELNQFCDLARGKCTTLDCDDDIYSLNLNSANFTFENAARLEAGDYRNLRVCPGTQDWFKIAFRSTDIVKVDINVRSGTSVEVRVFDQDGGLVSRDSRVEINRSFEFAPQRSGDFFFEFATNSNEKSVYDFKIQTQFCVNDIYEENDLISEAKNIPALVNVPVTLPLNGCPNDVDWFAFRNLNREDGLSLTFSQTSLPINGVLVTPSKEEIEFTKSNPFRALKLGEAGDYFVRVSLADQTRGAFSLSVESKPPWQCPDAGSHATPTTAISSDAAVGSHLLCPNALGFERDWIALPTLDGLVEISVKTAPDYDMEVSLWAGPVSAPNLFRASTILPDGERALHFQADQTKEYYLRISSESAQTQIRSLPSYSISLTPN